jgi:hypothetical protein
MCSVKAEQCFLPELVELERGAIEAPLRYPQRTA